ncbi:MAG: hypothetical protein WKF92_06335 [Pyrinomonadaceae bacterium]
MSEKYCISKLEHRTLLLFAFLVFAFFASFFIIEGIREYNLSVSDSQETLRNKAANEPKIKFAAHDFVPRVPSGFHLLTVFIFFALIRPGKLITSTFFTILYAAFFVLSLNLRIDGETPYGGEYPKHVGFFGELYRKTYLWDYLGAIYIAIAFVWQFSIIRRIRHRLY